MVQDPGPIQWPVSLNLKMVPALRLKLLEGEQRTSKEQLPSAVFWDILEKWMAAEQTVLNQCLFAAVLCFEKRSSAILSFLSLKIFTELGGLLASNRAWHFVDTQEVSVE